MGCCQANAAEIKYEGAAEKGPDSGRKSLSDKATGSGKGSSKAGSKRVSVTETKISQALLKKKMEHATDSKPLSFERILLRFDKLRKVLGYVKDQFNQVANEHGKLDHDGLQSTMKRLNVDMSLDDILDLFDFVNVQEKKEITMKEFLVALTIGMVLDAIPALADQGPVDQGPKPGQLRRSFSRFLGHNLEIKEMLNLIVSAYLIFDPEGKGYIEKSGIEKMVEEDGHKQGNNAMLSQQRWNEMVRL